MNAVYQWALRWYRFARTDRYGRPHYKPPAAGNAVHPPQRAAKAAPQPPGPPGPLPGSPHGRWLKSVDICENATIITDWVAMTSEVFPAEWERRIES